MPFYHSSDSCNNTKEINLCGALHQMNETIGTRLKRLRKAAKLTQTALANKVGIAQGQIGNIETDQRGYGLSVVAIAQALNTSPEYLTLETDDKAPKVGALERAQELPLTDKPLTPAALALAQWYDTIPEGGRMEAHTAIVQVIIAARLAAKAENQPIHDTLPALKLETQHE